MTTTRTITLLLFSVLCAAPLRAQPVAVHIVKTGEAYQLTRAGQAYFIRGAGGSGPKPMLRDLGANSFRTWDTDDGDAQLKEAQALGMTVSLGLWLKHQGQEGFSYRNASQVAEQFEAARKAIDRFKGHPALLLWGIGNEMEMGQEEEPAVWQAIEQIAAYAKKVDPNHPTMTVVAEISDRKLAMLAKHCPSIDVVGINAYGGAATLAERYRKSGGSKPFVVTEFGPAGPWEVAKKPWGSAIEASSTDKAAQYRGTYLKSIINQPLSLGSYAFIWGHKQEASATWFGLLLPDGSRLAAVDTLHELWTGKPIERAAPAILSLTLQGPDQVLPDATVHLTLDLRAETDAALRVEWVLQLDPPRTESGGADEAVPPIFPKAIVRADSHSADIRMPRRAGGYRVFAYVRDGRGAAAVANVALLVQGDAPPMKN